MRINLEHLFVTYPIALKLKKLKFHDGVMAYFKEDKRKTGKFELWPSLDPDFHVKYQHGEQNKSLPETLTSAPTHEQVFDWLKKKYNINIDIGYINRDERKKCFAIVHFKPEGSKSWNKSKAIVADKNKINNKTIKYALTLIK